MKIYKDVLLKTNFYKERVLNDLIRNGVSPSRSDVNAAVERIDRFLALYQYKAIRSGSCFDMDEFYESMHKIEQDLKFLYLIVYEVAVKEYESLYQEVENHLKGLEQMANALKTRAKMELGSTSLGETIFFQGNGFESYTVDEDTFVDLGSIPVRLGSRIAFLFDGDNILPENVVLSLSDGQKASYLAPYNYMQDISEIPGERVRRLYRYEERQDQIVNTSFQLIAEGLAPSKDKEYRIMAGKDSLILKNHRGENIVKKNESNNYYAIEPGLMTLFLYEATFARFAFSKLPAQKNFEGLFIEDLGKFTELTIDSQGDLSFEIVTDGEVYAEVSDGLIKDGRLFYPKRSQARDFLIEETLPGEIVNMQAHLKVRAEDAAPVRINSVVLKSVGGNF